VTGSKFRRYTVSNACCVLYTVCLCVHESVCGVVCGGHFTYSKLKRGCDTERVEGDRLAAKLVGSRLLLRQRRGADAGCMWMR
jgi:hypothetical protein